MKKKSGFTPLEITAYALSYAMRNKKDKTCYTNITFDGRKRRRRFLSLTGFTLMEVLIAAVILTLSILSATSLFMHLLSLVEEYRDPVTLIFTPQQYTAQEQMEIRLGLSYIKIKDDYTNNGALKQTPIIDITNNLNRSGVIYAQELAADGLIRIKVVVCYRQRNRIVGEDTNFNGVLDFAEDANGNGELDSPRQIETVVANRG